VEERISEIRHQLESDCSEVASVKDINDLKVKYLGKKGPVQGLMPLLKGVSSEERPKYGKIINDLKKDVEGKLEGLLCNFSGKEEEQRLRDEWLDVTLPGRKRSKGKKHPVAAMLDQVLGILGSMGFVVKEAPVIESDYYNFEALNFPPDHPARDMQDTFFLRPDLVLRTHTSNTQVRVMEGACPPIRVVAPGCCYRNEEISARSHVMFHQVEAFYVDEGVSFGDLTSTVEEFVGKLLGKDISVRMRPSYFPFVEPGMEVDVKCVVCKSKGCPVCKHTGWLEIGGAGMIHPEVMKSSGIDPEKYTGYAWGFGVERLVMMKYGIKDIRLFTDNNMRFLNQF
jgi:phenylalanyl-tRNA synthetase alpha chain